MLERNKNVSHSDAPSIFYPTRYFAGLPRLSNQSPKPKATSSTLFKDMADGESTESANPTNMSKAAGKIGSHARKINDANCADATQEISNGGTDPEYGESSQNSATPTMSKQKGRSKAYARVDNMHIAETDTRTKGRVYT